MTITTATLAGSTNNQDRLVVGDGFAAVLDGATSVAGDRSHDPGWYAGQLALALRETVPRAWTRRRRRIPTGGAGRGPSRTTTRRW